MVSNAANDCMYTKSAVLGKALFHIIVVNLFNILSTQWTLMTDPPFWNQTGTEFSQLDTKNLIGHHNIYTAYPMPQAESLDTPKVMEQTHKSLVSSKPSVLTAEYFLYCNDGLSL